MGRRGTGSRLGALRAGVGAQLLPVAGRPGAEPGQHLLRIGTDPAHLGAAAVPIRAATTHDDESTFDTNHGSFRIIKKFLPNGPWFTGPQRWQSGRAEPHRDVDPQVGAPVE